MIRGFLLGLLLAFGACAPAPVPRYVLGEPYRLGGTWSYPREDFGLDARGVAEVLPPGRGLTANGEARTDGMFAQHRTLQLPAIVVVTNLETGLSARVRVNDRGPESPGRIIGVTPRVASLLGASGPFQARVAVDGEASRAAIAGLAGQAAPLPVATAPVGRVEREALPPPEGARGGAGPVPAARPALAEATPAAASPAVLPEVAERGPAAPGRLWIEGNRFFRRDLAEREAARLPAGQVLPVGPRGRGQAFQVRFGPFATLPQADRVLAQALAAGIGDANLVVE
jgi:rare lipoprotein A